LQKAKEIKIEDYTNGYLDEIKAFAKTHPNGESLTESLQALETICKNREWDAVQISKDFAPMSLYFQIVKNDEHTDTANCMLNGGIIYHGSHDGFGSGSSPTLSVTMDKADGWRIHT